MIDLKVLENIAVIADYDGKTTEINRVLLNGCKERYDLGKWNGDERISGIIMTYTQLQYFKKVLCDID